MTRGRATPTLRAALLAAACAAALTACGGGSGDPLSNPATVSNPAVAGTTNLAFAYFQRCINPIFVTPQTLQLNGRTVTNTCAAAGCHADATGAGGAFRIVPTAQPVNLDDPTLTADQIRASDMYKNFYSAQGEAVIGNPTQSLIVRKPLLLNVLHGGGEIFSGLTDPNIQRLEYWINNPAPAGQDEFSAATYAMFTPADPMTGACNTQ